MMGGDYGQDPKTARRLMRALDQASAKLEAADRAVREPIAVVGMGCRFPGGSDSPDAFWQRLSEGFDGVCETPEDRWDLERFYDPAPDAEGKIYSRHGGFLGQVDGLDARFFEIAPREAASMDPQQRLFLEVAWEAFEQAGIPPLSLRRSRTGVFVGATVSEYGNLLAQAGGVEKIDAWFGAGNALNSIAGRVAHTLGLQGPAMAIDTACSSSLVAVHLACQSLRNGECDLALAGGVNLVLSPEVMIAICRARMLAADGRCKTFAAAADGYVRGEGCGAIVLKRLSDAVRDRDNILAQLRGSAVNQDGPSSGFTVPNGQAQQDLIRQALTAARLEPSGIDYLEAHGTGTSLGDPIEVQAAAAVLGEGRSPDRPLLLGSVKTNIGHLEAAAGIAGLIKAVLAVKNGEVPKHLHFQDPNPHVPWGQLPVEVASQARKWPQTGHPRRAGVSSFGASGTNAHVLVEQAPETKRVSNVGRDEPTLHLLAISAKTPEALGDLAQSYRQLLAESRMPLADVCFSANTGRSHFDHRMVVLAATAEEASNELQCFLRGESSCGLLHSALKADSIAGDFARLEDEEWESWLRRLAELYVRGGEVDWNAVYDAGDHQRVPLPTYPWQRKCHWFERAEATREVAATVPGDAKETTVLRALQQGDVESLGERLAADGRFSSDEKALFPKLLQVLADRHRDEQSAALMHQWLYEVKWLRQLRSGPQSPPDFLPSADEVCQGLQSEAAGRTSSAEFGQYWQGVNAAEELAGEYVISALSRMGLDRDALRNGSVADLQSEEQIDVRHLQLMDRLSKALAEAAANDARPEVGDPSQKFRDLLDQHRLASAELTLLDRCGSRLDDVLLGRCDPLPLLFPDSDDCTAAQLYEDSPGARVMNGLVGQAIALLVADLPADRKLRVLEIGAGTGGTTSSILPQLPAELTEYVFTDVSAGFTATAQAKFADYPFIRYLVLDIERSPESQGFETAQFDLVIAANVLHATRDLGESVRHARELLAPGGALVLLEGTQPMLFLDLIFGLTEGWWRFADHDLRPSYPLLKNSDWRQLLLDSGFSEAEALAAGDDEDDGGILSKQTIVVARATAEEFSLGDRRPAQHWTILADRSGVGHCLASLARAQGDEVVEVYVGDGFEETRPGEFLVAPENADDLQRAFDATGPAVGMHRVIHLWSLDVPQGDHDTAAKLGCRSVLNLVQCFAGSHSVESPHLCLVTRQAVAALDGDKLEGLVQSPLWGMARVLTAEHPELKSRRFDLGGDGADVSAQGLFEELCSDDQEDEIAFRSGARLVSRLVRADEELGVGGGQSSTSLTSGIVSQHGSPVADAAYLITGGLGGLGLLIAKLMAEKGARHLVLAGRRGASEDAVTKIRDIERIGACVTVCQADISKRADVVRVLAQIDKASPPLRGVIHAAGVLDDGVVQQLTWERFARVVAPKMDGAWHLHQLTKDADLDFFLLFSSATSLLGSPGQANHAAANAYLDALAHYRQGRGLPALSINWGAWSEVGAAAGHDVSQRVKLKGIGTISPSQGLAVLDRLSGTPFAQVAVVPVDWTQQTDLPPRFGELVTPDSSGQQVSQRQEDGLKERILEAPPHRRHRLLVACVRESVAGVLGLDVAEIGSDDGFMELGMDSLSSIELRTRMQSLLHAEFSPTLAFDYPTVQQLADFLLRQLISDVAEHGDSPTVSEVVPENEQLENLSEDELGALIDNELNAAAK